MVIGCINGTGTRHYISSALRWSTSSFQHSIIDQSGTRAHPLDIGNQKSRKGSRRKQVTPELISNGWNLRCRYTIMTIRLLISTQRRWILILRKKMLIVDWLMHSEFMEIIFTSVWILWDFCRWVLLLVCSRFYVSEYKGSPNTDYTHRV